MKQRAPDRTARLLADVYEAYEEKLRLASAVDFDDLLVHMVAILKEHKDVRAELDRRFSYVLVDEYQDTNLAQYAIVRALSVDHPNICVTGDPDQSIYGWRGANLSNILEFEKDYPGCRVVTLERNYRSTKNIISVADHVIRFNRNRKPKALRTENPVGEPIELTIYSRETDEAEGVAAKINSLVQEGEYGFADIAVFCRVTALTRPIRTGLPVRADSLSSGGRRGILRASGDQGRSGLSEPDGQSQGRHGLRAGGQCPPRGLGKTSIEHLIAAARERGVPLLAMAREAGSVPAIKDKAGRGLEDFARLMDELAALRDRPAEEVVQQLLDPDRLSRALEGRARDNGEDRLANLDELITAAREFDQMHAGASIQDFLAEITLASAIDRWDEDSGAVTLMTLHAAKGLEFPGVFIVAIENGLLPHVRSAENDNQIEEERRLFFVGITRARRELYLSRCVVRMFRGQQQATFPSKFLARAARRADRGPRPLGRGPVRPSGNVRAPALGRPYRHEPRPSAAPRDFRLMTAADLAGGAGGHRLGRDAGHVDLDRLQAGHEGHSSRVWPGADRGHRRRRLRPQGAGRVRRRPRANLRSGQVAAPAHGHARARGHAPARSRRFRPRMSRPRADAFLCGETRPCRAWVSISIMWLRFVRSEAAASRTRSGRPCWRSWVGAT